VTSLEIAVTTFSVQSAKPGQRYGQLATLPVLNNASEVFLRAPLTKIPAGATVSSAVLRFYGLTAESGSRTLHVQPTSSQVDSNIKWTGRPGSTGTQSDLTKSSPRIGTAWDFAVTTAVQQVVSGQRVDFGWRLRGDAATANLLRLAGSSAAKRKPVLLVTYSVVPPAPENLHPSGGAVSVAKPSLTFDAHNAILALQVQVDPAQNATTPAFDSGTVAA